MLIYKCWPIRGVVFFFPVFSTMTRCFTFPLTQLFTQQSLDHCESKKEKSWLSGFFFYCTLKADLKYAFLKIRGNHSECNIVRNLAEVWHSIMTPFFPKFTCFHILQTALYSGVSRQNIQKSTAHINTVSRISFLTNDPHQSLLTFTHSKFQNWF